MKIKKNKFIYILLSTVFSIILIVFVNTYISSFNKVNQMNNHSLEIKINQQNSQENLNQKQKKKPKPIILPQQTPLGSPIIDPNNVITYHLLSDGKLAYNVFTIAMQAMEGRKSQLFLSIDKSYTQKGLLPRQVIPGSFHDPYQEAAYKWLEDNATPFGNNGLIWYYQFDNAYNDVEIKAPWGSAFGQAHVIKAFIHAFKMTGEQKYKQLALKATKPFFTPIESGGFRATLPDGSSFFEEVPRLPATHILNGHMISTVTLLEAGQELNEPELKKLGQMGVETLKKYLEEYDLGYWSRYDMNPKKGEIVFRLSPFAKYEQSPILIDHAIIICSQCKDKTDLDIGSSDDAEGAWRISGNEWLQPQIQEQKTVRGLVYGLDLHSKPVQGGTRQNSYIIMQLPQLKFVELSKVPDYYLRIDYFDNKPGQINVEIQDINHGNFMGFKTLTNGTIISSGSQKWQSVFIPIKSKYLSWHMGYDYQVYHIQLLKQLAALTNESVFSNYADRWQTYLDMYSQENIEAKLISKN